MKKFKVNKGFELRHNGKTYKEGFDVLLSDKESLYLLSSGTLQEIKEEVKEEVKPTPKPKPEPVKEIVEEKPKKKVTKKKSKKEK